MMQYGKPRNIILTKVGTHNTEFLGEWTAKLNTRKHIFACLLSIHNTISLSRHEQVHSKHNFGRVNSSFFFFSIDYYTESFVLFYLLNIETNFELWKVAKPGTLKYEKPICIKTSRNKNKSKSWKQLTTI